MAGAPEQVRRAQGHGETVVRSRGFEWGARAGLVARGAVYMIIGVLAVDLAIGRGGEAASQEEALTEIAQQPFGKTLLVLTAIGLAGYAVWRLVRAAIGHGPEDSDGTFDRIGGLISGIGYLLLCIAAIEILISSGADSGSSGGGMGGGGGSGGSGDQASSATGGVLGWTGGVYLVGIAGVATMIEGLDQGYKAITKKFLEDSKVGEMSPSVKTWFTRLGVFGHLARMVVFMLIGWFLLKAAIDFNPDAAISLDGALTKLVNADYGPYLLGVVAFGLIGFGIYSLADARYRKV